MDALREGRKPLPPPARLTYQMDDVLWGLTEICLSHNPSARPQMSTVPTVLVEIARGRTNNSIVSGPALAESGVEAPE